MALDHAATPAQLAEPAVVEAVWEIEEVVGEEVEGLDIGVDVVDEGIEVEDGGMTPPPLVRDALTATSKRLLAYACDASHIITPKQENSQRCSVIPCRDIPPNEEYVDRVCWIIVPSVVGST